MSTNVQSAPNAFTYPSLSFVMIGHTFLTLLFPLLIALFYFSTPQSRRWPTFILNVVAIAVAFVEGIMTDALAIHSILSPQAPWPQWVNIAVGIVGVFQSLFVNVILLVHLISVRTLRNIGPTRFVALTAFPFLFKIVRIVNLILFTQALAEAAHGLLGAEDITVAWSTTPYLKVEWSVQTADNVYITLAYLWAMRYWGHGRGIMGSVRSYRVTVAQRLHTLSRIVLSNFILPTVLSVALLIAAYCNVDVQIVNEIILANNMLAVFGVVFATVWARRNDVGLREASQIDLWDDGSQVNDDGVKPVHLDTIGLPGLESWRVASPPGAMAWRVEIPNTPY